MMPNISCELLPHRKQDSLSALVLQRARDVVILRWAGCSPWGSGTSQPNLPVSMSIACSAECLEIAESAEWARVKLYKHVLLTEDICSASFLQDAGHVRSHDLSLLLPPSATTSSSFAISGPV